MQPLSVNMKMLQAFCYHHLFTIIQRWKHPLFVTSVLLYKIIKARGEHRYVKALSGVLLRDTARHFTNKDLRQPSTYHYSINQMKEAMNVIKLFQALLNYRRSLSM